MPLHLLGKKSWNVYNTANIEKVRKDEALAAAAEAAEEERMQALDAERRMQILRGETPTPLAIEDAPASPSSSARRPRKSEAEHGYGGRERKRRKKAGENDTDFEMRVAREKAEDAANVDKALVLRKPTSDSTPIVDSRGNISLFSQPVSCKGDAARKEKNPEAEREAQRKKKEYEDQYTMRFSNAAGFKQSIGAKAWYEREGREEAVVEAVGKDVWGNEDPRRKEREAQRTVSSDPLAMMKAGAKRVREVEAERKRWREEREREMREMDELESRERRRKRKRGIEDEDDGLDGFRLDDDRRSSTRRKEERDPEREERHRHKESRRKEHRDERHRHRHHHRHRHRHDD